jgi:DNA-3-methyladenine glycosylase II
LWRPFCICPLGGRGYYAGVYKKAREHFKKVDEKLYLASLDIDLAEIEFSKDLFRDIIWTIVGQQLSARSADAIFFRLEALFGGMPITPEGILNLSETQLRSVGLSGAKARAIQAFSIAVESGSLDLRTIESAPDSGVREALIQVKGIGPWTAEMILMFSLARPDIFSKGDLGLRRGLMHLYKLRKEPSESRVEKIVERWSPYKTYAARVLWKLSDKKTNRVGRKKTMSKSGGV